MIAAALAQVPRSYRHEILIRIDGAGASHALIEHLLKLNTRRRRVGFTIGFPITGIDEQAIAELPEHAWGPSFEQDGSLDPHAEVAELTGLWRREGWP